MKKDVLIRVRGLQMMDTEDEQEPLEIVVPGQYYYRNGSHYLRYEEMMDDTAQPTVNYIKLSPQGVEVRKQGQVNVHMVFEQGKKNMTLYSTPFGTCGRLLPDGSGTVQRPRRFFFLRKLKNRYIITKINTRRNEPSGVCFMIRMKLFIT